MTNPPSPIPEQPTRAKPEPSLPEAGGHGPRHAWQPGELIANLYEVKAHLGAGAFGDVYRVHHRGWNLDIAMKAPNSEVLGDPDRVQRIVQECETWVALGLHPHLVSCFYVRILEGIPLIFMEYVDGRSLWHYIVQEPLRDWTRIVDLAIQLCRGMQAAHAKGLVHRDLKPGNCLLQADGTLKVSDFGLAKVGLSEDAPEPLQSHVGARLPTGGPGTVGWLGTPEYMAPEQWQQSGSVTFTADLWSFGVILYEMGCRRRPFRMEHEEPPDAFYARMVTHRWAYTPPEQRSPSMPLELHELIAQCLTVEPKPRLAQLHSFAEIDARLESLYQELTGSPYPRPPIDEAPLLADSLNNQAISLIDLGRAPEASALFNAALTIEPTHPQATYNGGLLRWRRGELTDLEALHRLEEVKRERSGSWMPAYLLGLVHLERADREGATQELEEALRQAGSAAEIEVALSLLREEQRRWAGCLRTFEGHTRWVISAAVSPDGRYALSGSEDHTLRLWELDTGACLRTFEGHTRPVSSVALSPDGRYALSGSDDHTLRLWELTTGRCLRTFEGHTNWVDSVAISPDGRSALSGSDDHTLRLWELATGTCLRTLEGHTNAVRSVALSPDGRYALSGSLDRTIRLWELHTDRCLRTFEGHACSVRSVALSPDGRYALSGSDDHTLRLWELTTGRCLRTFEGHTNWVDSVAISPDGRSALSGSRDRTLRLWELATGRCLRTFEGHTVDVHSVAFSPDGRYALWGGDSLQLWELVIRQPSPFLAALPRSAAQVSREAEIFQRLLGQAKQALQDGSAGLAAELLREARQVQGYHRSLEALALWHAIGRKAGRRKFCSGWHVRTFEGHACSVRSVALSPDGRYALSGSDDHTLRLWELATGTCLRTLEGHTNAVRSVALSPDGRYALSGSDDHTLRLWELATGTCLRTFEGHTDWVSSVALSHDGRSALSGSRDRTLRLWELATGRCLRTFEGHTDSVNSVALSPDGRYALSGSYDRTLRLWELSSGRCVRTFEGRTSSVTSVAISPDGRSALSGSSDRTLRLWELTTGRCVRTFEGHTGSGWVLSVALSPDGRYALSGSSDRTLRLWELTTGRCVRTFEGHTGSGWVRSVALSPDGRYALSGSADCTLRLWELEWDYDFPEPADCDEEVRPYLTHFLTLQTPVGPDGVSRVGRPSWDETDLQRLLEALGHRGCGWLRPEGVRRELERMAQDWADGKQRAGKSLWKRLFKWQQG